MYGYGNSMFLATHGILARTASGGGVDPDAQAFITAAAITDPTQQAAINTLVVDLKGYSIWSKMKALYPFCGGSASSHKFNLKDPRDLDAAFRLVFSGGWTHNSNGITGNGVNTTANTKLVNNAHLTATNGSFGFYLRNTQSANVYDFSPGGFFGIALYIDTRYYMYGGLTSIAGLPSPAFYGLSRVGGTHKGYRNGVVNLTSTSAASLNAGEFSFNTNLRNYAFGYIADGLTDAENTNLYTAVQAFQTTLGRSIGTQTVSDADAQAFVTAANIQDQVEANAINNLVIGMKADGLWTKMKAVYPFVGGSSSTMKFNLKNPLDTDAAFRLVFNGGAIFSSNGYLPNGTNGYADTKLIANNTLSISSGHLSVYSRTNLSGGVDMGSVSTLGGTFEDSIFSRWTDNKFYANYGVQTYPNVANTDSRGLFITNRNSATNTTGYKNGSRVIDTAQTSGLSRNIMPIGAYNNNGTFQYYSNREYAFASIGDGLTDTDATNLNTRVTTFQTALNRNV
jgi:hypothetical protein